MDGNSQQVDSQPTSVDLIWGLATTWLWVRHSFNCV